MNTNEKLMLDFHYFMVENENNRSEKLVDDYYRTHKNEANEKELLKLCLYEKALIARDAKEFNKSNDYYLKILNTNLKTDKSEEYLLKLCICQNCIELGEREQALRIVEEYFKSESKDYDFEFLVCYARLNKGRIEEPYICIANTELSRLGYQNNFPKTYDELIEVFNLYKLESNELHKVLLNENTESSTQLLEVFKEKSNFTLLINQVN